LQAASHYGVELVQTQKVLVQEDPDDNEKIEVYIRAYEREKTRRQYAEKMLEDKSRDLFLSSKQLSDINAALTDANTQLENQYSALTLISDDFDRVKEDLSYAAKIQNSLLPAPTELPKIAITGTFKPAQFVAGDGYDFFPLTSDIYAFYIIDVVGHGTAAAMISFAVQIQLNPKADGICRKHLDSSENLNEAVSNTLNELNDLFYDDDSSNRYFTMIYGLIDLKNGDVNICQAGHPPPLLLHSDSSEVSAQGKGGTPVAILDTPLFGIHEFNMSVGDRLFVYSDGVTECRNDSDEEFGDENLVNEVVKCASLSLQQSADALTSAVTEWNGGEEFEDDLSLFVLEYR